eukprot:TRINITY_DN2251_c0_g1_i2.p1 TRINITY_DN2251_c0_g1~~TRINITY_DN2251_c0_g1_i2.p1  ORF type:complete len:352 (-),score=32.61 TRINITY_DN2251_c0_g1_i2:209-1264(-)
MQTRPDVNPDSILGGTVGLVDLPDELLYYVALQLSVPDITSLSSVSHAMHGLLNQNAFWQLMCDQNQIIVSDSDSFGDVKSLFLDCWNRLLCIAFSVQLATWEAYELRAGRWSEGKVIAQLTHDCTNSICRVAWNRIYILEGSVLWQCNPYTGEFILCAQQTSVELPGCHAMCYDNGELYVVGNTTQEIFARRADTAEADWRVIGSLDIGEHEYPAIAVIANKLYVCSSRGSECFDLRTGRLCDMAQIEMQKFPAYCVYQDRLWLGISSPSSYELVCYDLKGNFWTRVSRVPTKREFATLAVYQGRLWMIAGAISRDYCFGALCESYDVATNTWRTEHSIHGLRNTPCGVA